MLQQVSELCGCALERGGNEPKGCVIWESLKSSSRQAVNEMVASGVDNVGARGLRQSTKRTGLDEFCYRTVFRGEEVMECFMLKKLKLAGGEMLRREAVSGKLRWFDEKQHAKIALLRSIVKYYEWQGVSRSIAVSSNRDTDDKRNKAVSNDSFSGGGSFKWSKKRSVTD